MARKFSELVAKMPAASRARAEAKTRSMLAAMPLHVLRQARGLSQKDIAEILKVQQPSVAKLERRTDMYLSTLRNHVEAMGGQLEIIARFPDGAVRIDTPSAADAESSA